MVDKDGHGTKADCTASDTAYTSVQAAITAATAGDTVYICPSTYSVTDVQGITVDKSLTIEGASKSSVYLDGSDKNGTTNNGRDPLVSVTASNVTIKNLVVDLGDDDTDYNVGVFTPNDGSVDNLTVDNTLMRFADYGAPGGAGEQLIHLGGGTGNTVSNNDLETGSSNSVIYVGDSANDSLTVTDNYIHNISDTDGGGTALNSCGPVTNSTISANTFTGAGIGVYLGSGPSATHDDTVTRNTFQNTTAAAPYGAVVLTSDSLTAGIPTTGIDVTENEFFGGAGPAVSIFDNSGSDVDGDTITVTSNEFAGNNGAGIDVGDGVTGTVDGSLNEWGALSGPSGAASGSGDAVSSQVDYTPFLRDTTETPAGTETDGFQPAMKMLGVARTSPQIGATNRIQEAVDAAAPSAFVRIFDGTYSLTFVPGVTIDKPLTLAGTDAANVTIDGSSKDTSTNNGADVLLDVAADGVKLEMLTIDLGNDDADYDVGVFTPNDGSVDNLNIRYSRLRYADYGNNPGEQLIHLGGGTGNTVHATDLETASLNSSIYLGDQASTNLTVSNDTFEPVSDADGGGTAVNSFAPVVGSTFSDNTFTRTGLGIYLGSGSSATQNDTIAGNTFTGTTGTHGAVFLTSEQDGVSTGNITLTGNTFTGTAQSPAIWLKDSATPSNPDVRWQHHHRQRQQHRRGQFRRARRRHWGEWNPRRGVQLVGCLGRAVRDGVRLRRDGQRRRGLLTVEDEQRPERHLPAGDDRRWRRWHDHPTRQQQRPAVRARRRNRNDRRER